MLRLFIYCCLAASASFFYEAACQAAGASQESVAVEAPEAAKAQELELNARAGIAFFANARSLALPHRVKPSARVSVWFPMLDALDVGGGLSGIVTSSSNYGVWGAYGLGRYRILDDQFRLNASLGLGVGHNAPIIHSDLMSGGPILPYVHVGIEALFAVTDALDLGVELANEQISILHLGLALSLRL